MVWYVAVIAVLNLGLGYALATLHGAQQAKWLAAMREASP